MLMWPVDRLARFPSGLAMMAELSAIWAVNIENMTGCHLLYRALLLYIMIVRNGYYCGFLH